MSNPPHDPFDRCSPGFVPKYSREDRVRLLGELADAVLAGEPPPRNALIFLATALSSWLQDGGSLTRDFLQTAGAQGCTVTEAHLWRRMQSEPAGKGSSRRAHESDDSGKMEPSNKI